MNKYTKEFKINRSNYFKLYYQNNKERINATSKEYYQNNKEKVVTYHKKYRKKYPWRFTLKNIRQRCRYPNDVRYKYYGGKGIKCFLTPEQIKYLWFRDKAPLMKQPSIHRENNNLHYTLENCRFIEMREHGKIRTLRLLYSIPPKKNKKKCLQRETYKTVCISLDEEENKKTDAFNIKGINTVTIYRAGLKSLLKIAEKEKKQIS